MKVVISDAAACILNLDATAKDRGVECSHLSRHRNLVEGDRAAIVRLRDELRDVASGVQCDDSDNPARTRRVAREQAERIHIQLAIFTPVAVPVPLGHQCEVCDCEPCVAWRARQVQP